MGKALLIKSSAGQKENIQGVWHKFEQATPYIQGIETGDLVENITAETLNSMISGLPNVWSRARIFGYAFKYVQRDANIQVSGLIKFYELLVREWKGLIGLLALFPDRISISSPLFLNDNENEHFYNITGSFGRMIFEDTDLWCNPAEVQATKQFKPFIQLIYYNDVLIGATSPYSLLFTGIDYDQLQASQDVKWYRNGKLDDPVEFGNLNNHQLQKIYLLVNNLVTKLPPLEKNLQINRNDKEFLNLSPLFSFLQNWATEIKQKGNNLVEEGALDADLTFAEPFRQLFSIKQDVYYKNGIFSFADTNGEAIDIQKILLQDEFLYNISETDSLQPHSKSAVYYLTAPDPDDATKEWHFPLPLSAYGLKLFGNRVGELLSPPLDEKHELRAHFRPQDYKVTVELILRIDGKKQTPVSKEYDVRPITGMQRNIIMWPNFISKDWTKYFIYSEYPTNGRDLKFVPFFREFSANGGFDGGKYVCDTDGNLIYSNSKNRGSELLITNLVKYPAEIATSDDHPYEVIRANKPVGGLEIRAVINGKDCVCGYLIIKGANDETMGDNKIADLSHETNFEEVVVGIDFGSNNSCLSFSKYQGSEVSPVEFTNKRVFLLGTEIIDENNEKLAERNELLFFQNEISTNGQIKSWIHDHNHKYISTGMEQEEIAGGVPVFEPNIVIHEMDSRTITTNAGILHHSMKWLTDIKGKEKKKAYLKTVWLKAVSDLYAKKLIPRELKWSYPGSFSQFDILQYEQMYRELGSVPINNVRLEVSSQPSTEAEAVCNYALTHIGLSGRNIMLGIDVGGSTSDILIVAMDRQARAFRMVKQSSLRMAAGIMSDIITRKGAEMLRKAIYKYHESPNCKIKVANIKNIIDKPNTAPFYLNAIFDRLDDNDFGGFYSSMSQSTPDIFAIPAYITGMLLFYSGQLVAKAIRENNFTEISTVELMPFGKGGRIFDWLDTYPGKRLTEQYYNDCFKAGFGEGADKINLLKKDDIRKDNKSEVAKGLSAPQKVTTDNEVRDNSDIFGEDGFTFHPSSPEQTAVELMADDTIKTHHLEEMDFGIDIPVEFKQFNRFLDIFVDFVGPQKTGIIRNISLIAEKRNDLHRELKGFIINDAEWQKADRQKKQGQVFEYKHSMLVLEGLCFLEKFIIPKLFAE